MVSGVILLAFGVAAWVFVYKNLLKSVDSRLQDPVEQLVRRVHEGRDWVRFREGMRFFGREFEQETMTMVMSNTSGKRLFASELSSWIAETETFKSHLPSAEELANAPPPPSLQDPRERPPRGSSATAETGMPPGLLVPGSRGDRPGQRGRGPWEAIGEPHYFTVTGKDGTRWRTVSSSNASVTVFIGIDLASFETEVHRVRSYFGVALPLGLLAIAAGAWAISRRAMRPLDRIIATTSGMSAAELDKRIPVTGRESGEFSKLVEELNAMMDRLEASFHQATRFTADASHELKTPIAIMQAEIESALKSCPPGSPEESSLLNMQEENQRLKRITQSLLLLAQVDSGKLKLAEEEVDLSGELEALAEDAEYLCAKAGLKFTSDIAPGLKVRADRVLLMQAMQNLLSNAIKYNDTPGGEVSCRLYAEAGDAVVEFYNTGTPIPDEDRAKIFDRFYRVDRARGPGVEGVGLGLNLSLEIVRAHRGTLKLAGSDAAGTRMELRLAKA